jgi:MFS family permease
MQATTVSTPLWGKLGGQYGRKIFFQASIVIFLVGSVLSGLSHPMMELILFRAIQGLGAVRRRLRRGQHHRPGCSAASSSTT